MRRIGPGLAVVALGALLLTPALHAPALAQPAPAVKQDDAHSLARAFLVKVGVDKQLDSIMLATRDLMIVTFKGRGISDENAALITDRYMLPEFRARAPELMERFEDVMVTDFTAPKLQALVTRDNPDALRSAQAKAGQMPAHFQAAGEAWGRQVGEDAYAKNKADIDKLGGSAVGAKP
jgi:hypothetical protein